MGGEERKVIGNNKLQPRPVEGSNRASTWMHHLGLEPDGYGEGPPTPPKPTHPPLPPHPSLTPYLFLRPSFPSFAPLNVDHKPSNQSDANFLAANTAASDTVSDSLVVAALRRVRSAGNAGAWRDGCVEGELWGMNREEGGE